jgi:presenilin-like A22 family membrane protease
MKHTWRVTVILLGVFILSQLIGLSLIAAGAHVGVDAEGNRIVQHDDTALGARPETTGFASFTYILVGVIVGTLVLLVLIYFRLLLVWKLWFFSAVWLASTSSLGAILPTWIATIIALVLAAWKIWRPNVWIHNITEVLVYSGIALLIAPIFNLFYMALLLVVISVYDAYAVWRSKHMVKMAQFQTESKLFAGLLIPYGDKPTGKVVTTKPSKAAKSVPTQTTGRSAILGGGDIAFPLLFSGVVYSDLLLKGFSGVAAYAYTLLVVAGAAASLFLLFYYAKKDAFYPAMPFLSAGCFIGYAAVWLLTSL